MHCNNQLALIPDAFVHLVQCCSLIQDIAEYLAGNGLQLDQCCFAQFSIMTFFSSVSVKSPFAI